MKKLDEIDEQLLLSMKDGSKSRKELILLAPTQRIGQRRIETLSKYGFIKRTKQGIYNLDSKGRGYIEKRILSDKALSIGQDLWKKVSDFIIDKVPTETYQAVVRLTLSEMRAKQSELFTNFKNQFNAGWSGPLLAGQPKAMKSPIGELICKIRGLDPEEQKFPITGTKSEFGYPYRKGKDWKYRPSRWHKEAVVLIDDWHRIINKDARDTALSLARGNRTFKRYGEKFTNQVVPFIALNTHTDTIPETTEKIIKEIGEEDVKRLIVVNVDYLAPYLEDTAILTRKMLRGVPRLDFKAFPIKKKELTDKEFNFMCRLLKESTKEKKGEFFDERSIEILILGRYALAKNRDIIGTIFQTCWDRLLCLETLDVTKDGWRESFRKKWKEHVSIEQPKILEEEKKEEKREEERKKKIEKTEKEVIQQKAEKARQDLALVERKGELEANLKQLRSELPSPQMKENGWGTKQISIRKQINTLLDWLKAARTEDKLQICESQYPDVQSKQQHFMDKYRAWEKKKEEEKEQKEQASQVLKVSKDKLAKPFQDLRKRLNKFRLKEEKPIVEKAKELVDEAIEKIQGAKDLEELKEMESPLSLNSVLGNKISLPWCRRELEEKLEMLEQRRELIQEVEDCKKNLDKFDRQEEKDEVNEKKQGLGNVLSKIYQAESKTDLISLKPDLTIFKQKLDSLIVRLEQRRAQQKTREEDQKQTRKEQIQIQKQINKLQEEGKQKEREVNKKLQVIQNKKNEILEKWQKDIFDSRYLSSQEKAELDILLKYYKRKKAPVDGIFSFLKDLRLIKWMNLYNETKKGPLNHWGYLGIDNKEYSEFYFYHNWDRALPLIQVRIDQIKKIAIQSRKNKLAEEWWDHLDKEEQTLKSPLYYVRTNKRLVRARHLGEKEDQRLHFELEDGTPWMLSKGREWTVQTKIEYGGELLPYITEEGSTIVVQTNEGRKRISKDQIFCYTYEYKGPEPVKES